VSKSNKSLAMEKKDYLDVSFGETLAGVPISAPAVKGGRQWSDYKARKHTAEILDRLDAVRKKCDENPDEDTGFKKLYANLAINAYVTALKLAEAAFDV